MARQFVSDAALMRPSRKANYDHPQRSFGHNISGPIREYDGGRAGDRSAHMARSRSKLAAGDISLSSGQFLHQVTPVTAAKADLRGHLMQSAVADACGRGGNAIDSGQSSRRSRRDRVG